MDGTNANTGKPLGGLEHLRQSIRDILTTPLGSRVMRREYGSRLFRLVDAPTNRETITDIYAATAEALRKWEPRIKVTKVELDALTAGKLSLTVYGDYLPDGQPITIEGIIIS